MRLESWIGRVTKGAEGPKEEAEFCSSCDEEQGDDICFRGVTLAAAKYFNSNKLSIKNWSDRCCLTEKGKGEH